MTSSLYSSSNSILHSAGPTDPTDPIASFIFAFSSRRRLTSVTNVSDGVRRVAELFVGEERLLTPPPTTAGSMEGPACDEGPATEVREVVEEEEEEEEELMSVEGEQVEVGETVTEARFFDGLA